MALSRMTDNGDPQTPLTPALRERARRVRRWMLMSTSDNPYITRGERNTTSSTIRQLVDACEAYDALCTNVQGELEAVMGTLEENTTERNRLRDLNVQLRDGLLQERRNLAATLAVIEKVARAHQAFNTEMEDAGRALAGLSLEGSVDPLLLFGADEEGDAGDGDAGADEVVADEGA